MEDKMGTVCSMHGITDLREIRRFGLHASGSGYGPLAGSCEEIVDINLGKGRIVKIKSVCNQQLFRLNFLLFAYVGS
jgi:hypothetical protein